MFSLDYQHIADCQARDNKLQLLIQQKPEIYVVRNMGPCKLITRQGQDARSWKICIPDELLDRIIDWYHQVLSHTGYMRIYGTISSIMHHEKLKSRCQERIKSCNICQRSKLPGRGYGHLPPREANNMPWQEIAVDLIGPWTLKIRGVEITIRALTIIDTTTNLMEVVRIDNKSAAHVGEKFEQTWLARYPCPQRCVFDPGNEFKGQHFQRYLSRHGITPVPATAKNPQLNAICERVHQTMTNCLRALLHGHPIPPQLKTPINLSIVR